MFHSMTNLSQLKHSSVRWMTICNFSVYLLVCFLFLIRTTSWKQLGTGMTEKAVHFKNKHELNLRVKKDSFIENWVLDMSLFVYIELLNFVWRLSSYNTLFCHLCRMSERQVDLSLLLHHKGVAVVTNLSVFLISCYMIWNYRKQQKMIKNISNKVKK